MESVSNLGGRHLRDVAKPQQSGRIKDAVTIPLGLGACSRLGLGFDPSRTERGAGRFAGNSEQPLHVLCECGDAHSQLLIYRKLTVGH